MPGQNLADAGMTLKGSKTKTPKQQRTIVFVLGGPGSGKGTQVMSTGSTEMLHAEDVAARPQDMIGLLLRAPDIAEAQSPAAYLSSVMVHLMSA